MSSCTKDQIVDSNFPKYLDQIFIEKCLQHHCVDRNVELVNYSIKPATKKGDNYASYIFRVNVCFREAQSAGLPNENENKTNIATFIIKTQLSEGFCFEKLDEMHVYDKEMEMYEKVAPKLHSLLEQLGDKRKMFARTVYVSNAHKAVVLEDLSLKGYGINPNIDGYDMAYTKMILTKLAKFHGLCAVLQEQNPDVFKNFKYGLMSSEVGSLDGLYLTNLDALIEQIATWENYDYYVNKLRNLRSILIEKGHQAFSADPNHFNTLIHGDLWRTNIMLKYKGTTSELDNVAFLDFQFSCWTSPTIDLHYLFNTSLQEDLRLHHQEELVQYYHKKLVTVLKRSNYRSHVPTLLEFQVQFLQKSFYGFSASCLLQPIQINEQTEDADIEALLTGDERSMAFKRLIYTSPRVQKILRNVIPLYDRRGVFD